MVERLSSRRTGPGVGPTYEWDPAARHSAEHALRQKLPQDVFSRARHHAASSGLLTGLSRSARDTAITVAIKTYLTPKELLLAEAVDRMDAPVIDSPGIRVAGTFSAQYHHDSWTPISRGADPELTEKTATVALMGRLAERRLRVTMAPRYDSKEVPAETQLAAHLASYVTIMLATEPTGAPKNNI